MLNERPITSQRVYEGRVVNLRIDTLELPGGGATKREIVEHRGSVGIVAIDENRNVLLVRQYRRPCDEVLLEIPAGTLDPGEDSQECALREIQEETGFAANRIEKIGGFYTAPGYSSEYLHMFLATDLFPSPREADEDENIEVVRVPLADTPAMIASEEIHDGKSVAGLLMVLHRQSQPKR